MLREDVMLKNEFLKIVFVRVASLLVEHVYISERIEKFSYIMKFDVHSKIECLLALYLLQLLSEIFGIVNYIRSRYLGVDWHLDNAICAYQEWQSLGVLSIEVDIELRLSRHVPDMVFVKRKGRVFCEFKNHTSRAKVYCQFGHPIYLSIQIKEPGFPKEVLDILLSFIQEKQIEFLVCLAACVRQHFYNYKYFL